jgi:bifunctional DNA-binding transcriptional regulator/antitoxin component of YhaV-PrlF toxin-antitoxin module
MKKQEYEMPKVAIHGNQLTLPDDLRARLTTAQDDFLDAEEVDEGILLRRSESGRREAGWADIESARAGVRYVGPQPRPSAEEEEQWIADTLYAEKLRQRTKREQK